MTSTTRAVILALTVLMFTNVSVAEIYRTYPSSPLKLSAGFDPLRPTKLFPPCIESDGVDPTPAAAPANQTRYSSELITKQDDLFKKLQIDANLAARYAFVSASASISFSEEATFHSDDVVWVVKAFADYSDETLKNPRLNTDAKRLVGSPDDFRKRCGTEWVGQQHKMAQVAAVFSFHNVSDSLKRKMSASFAGDVSTMSGGGSISVNVKSIFAEATQSGRVTLNIVVVGGDGISDTGPFILKDDNLETVRQNLSKLVSKITIQNAAISSVTTGDFTSFYPQAQTSPNADPKMQELYFTYLDYASRYHRLGEILRGIDEAYAYLTDDQVNTLRAAYNSYATAVEQVFTEGSKCVKGQPCMALAPIVTRFDWPLNPEPNCTRWRHGLCYRCEIIANFQNKPAGSRYPVGCTHMPPNTTATADFVGYVVVDQGIPDNKIWNAIVTVELLAPTDQGGNALCSQPPRDSNCATHVGNYRGSPVFKYAWTEFRMSRKAPSGNGNPTWDIFIQECHTGPNINALCDTVPPGQSAVPNGLPSAVLAANVTIHVEPELSPTEIKPR